MYITAEHLREQVIKPTLEYLGAWSEEAERELLAAALAGSEAGSAGGDSPKLGIFRISPSQHRDLWDRYLAFRPEDASRVRGLASQRAFLHRPDGELQTNLSYSAAIAWFLLERTRAQSEWRGDTMAAHRSHAPRLVVHA
jgi:hypothetical protein